MHRDIFWFFLKDEEVFSKTINDSNNDLEKFPASKVRQLAKKMESSKSTTRHIKEVDSQVAQVNLLRHQRTDLLPSKSKWKQHYHKPRSNGQQRYSSEHKNEGPHYQKRFDPNQAHQRRDRCSKCGDSKHIEGFKCPARKYQCRKCKRYGHFTSLCYRRSESPKSRKPQVHQLQAGLIYMSEDYICSQSGDLYSSDESFCLQVQIQNIQASARFHTPHHLITNLQYKLKPHNKGNQYLRARLDTCTDVNIMPASVYKLVFQDPDCKKLASSSKLMIGTYTTDKVKVVASCVLYVVHPDTQCLQEITFYMANNNGSVVLSCVTVKTNEDNVPEECASIKARFCSVYRVQLTRYETQAYHKQW